MIIETAAGGNVALIMIMAFTSKFSFTIQSKGNLDIEDGYQLH